VRTERPELTRLVQKMFGLRGAPSADVTPVMVVDNFAMGPYQMGALFEVQTSQPAVAAQYSYIALRYYTGNPLVGPQKGAVVIERIQFRTSAAANLNWQTGQDIFTLGGLTWVPVAKRNTESDYPTSGTNLPVPLGDVTIAGTNTATDYLATTPRCGFWHGDALPHDATGPWIIGENQLILFRPDTVNVTLSMTFFGKFYPPA